MRTIVENRPGCGTTTSGDADVTSPERVRRAGMSAFRAKEGVEVAKRRQADARLPTDLWQDREFEMVDTA